MLWGQSCFAWETAPLCQRAINTRYVEVVEIALVCLNYERMTFRAVALESIAFEVDCSLKVFVPQGGTGPSPKCPSESGIFVFLIGLKALVQKDTSLLFDFMSVIHEGHCCWFGCYWYFWLVPKMSDLAENIRLYGGSRVLEMIQSLDSPVWKTQVCWFSEISLWILRAPLLIWATYCAWHIFQVFLYHLFSLCCGICWEALYFTDCDSQAIQKSIATSLLKAKQNMQRLEFEARLQYENEYQPALTQESLDDLERRLQQEVKVGIGLFHMHP